MTDMQHTSTDGATDKTGRPRPPYRLPWMEWKVGQRVVVRRREADGLYDSVGELLDVCPASVTIRTRKGDVTVPAKKMVTGKIVPPAPTALRRVLDS